MSEEPDGYERASVRRLRDRIEELEAEVVRLGADVDTLEAKVARLEWNRDQETDEERPERRLDSWGEEERPPDAEGWSGGYSGP